MQGGAGSGGVGGGISRDVAACTWAMGRLGARLREPQAVALLELAEHSMSVSGVSSSE